MGNGRKSAYLERSGSGRVRGLQALAALLVGLLRVDSCHWLPPPAALWVVFATRVGATANLILQDGSSVDLNTDSEIKVRFTGRRREAVLVRGEALFNVVRHVDWPFAVQAGVTTVRATGTKLSIRLREENRADIRTDVLVVDGGVSIDGGGAYRRVGYARAGVPFLLTLYPGELVSMNSTAVLTRMELSPAAVKRRTAWTQGWLWFAKDPLPEALAQFNRYRRKPLVLVDPALASLEIGGRFRSTDLESFITTLEHSFNVQTIPAVVHGADVETIYLTGRCARARQQCNWPLVQ